MLQNTDFSNSVSCYRRFCNYIFFFFPKAERAFCVGSTVGFPTVLDAVMDIEIFNTRTSVYTNSGHKYLDYVCVPTTD